MAERPSSRSPCLSRGSGQESVLGRCPWGLAGDSPRLLVTAPLWECRVQANSAVVCRGGDSGTTKHTLAPPQPEVLGGPPAAPASPLPPPQFPHPCLSFLTPCLRLTFSLQTPDEGEGVRGRRHLWPPRLLGGLVHRTLVRPLGLQSRSPPGAISWALGWGWGVRGHLMTDLHAASTPEPEGSSPPPRGLPAPSEGPPGSRRP